MTLQCNVDPQEIKAIVFDVDGTLYHQRRLRLLMVKQLLKYYGARPWRSYDIKVLLDFRRQREKRRLELVNDLAAEQYKWGAAASKVSCQRVQQVVEYWIEQRPLAYLKDCLYDGVGKFFSTLAQKKISRVILSDYPAQNKINAMGIGADMVFCATDPVVNCFKPHPRGLEVIMAQLCLEPNELLFIGDRDEVDGECARQAGVEYLLKVDHPHQEQASCFYSYHQLIDFFNKGQRI